MRFGSANALLRFAPVALGLALGTLLAGRLDASAKDIFERAYSAEKSQPDRAIELYRSALSHRLESKLRAAAYWRLFFLYKRVGQFGQALRIAERLGSAKRMEDVLKNLRLDVQNQFGISARPAQLYVDGLAALYRLRGAPAGERPTVFLAPFRQAVEAAPSSANLRTSISNALVEQGFGEYAGSFASGAAPVSETERRLAHAARLVAAERHEEAEQVLYFLARTGDLDNREKGRVLYMLARVERKRGHGHQAVAYFRLAARYAPAAAAQRHNALAAYVLYRDGYAVQAHALLRGAARSPDANVRLLQLILVAEIERNPAALAELRQMKEKLRGTPPAGISPFLAKRAVELAERAERRR